MGAQPWLSIQGATDEILSRAQTVPAGVSYGQLRSPPRTDLDELRLQQETFRQTREKLDERNWWMAVPALAPGAAVLGLEGGAAIAARFAPALPTTPLLLRGREPWPLGEAAKKAIREQARKIWARSNKVEARELDAHVHHSDPLQWAHLKPDADPNRLANLWALSPEEHAIANRAWRAFGQALNGRKPTPAEVMEAKLRIDRLLAPLVRSPGAARPNPPPARSR